MQKDDTSLINPADILTALALLTRLPVKAAFERSRQAVWAYPLAGVASAICAGAAVWIALALGVAPALAAGLWIVATVLVTGAMHEDGLADCADGFGGGWTPERRLEIMKDSQIGSYGVLALTLGIGLRWLAVWMLLETEGGIWTLFALEALSRSAMPALMHALPHARETGLSKSQGRPTLAGAGAALALAAGISLLTVGFVTLKLLFVGALVTLAAGVLAQRKIGGQTGDVLGATQQLVLIALLITTAD